jgi:hypothetical protein
VTRSVHQSAKLAVSDLSKKEGRVSEAWEDEGFGTENDYGAESVESDVEEEVVEIELEEDDDTSEDTSDDTSDDEQ